MQPITPKVQYCSLDDWRLIFEEPITVDEGVWMFTNLFSPVKINSVTLPNRIAMPPFGLNFTGMKRNPNERLTEFYRERAAGGVGLLTVGGVGVDLRGSGFMLPGIDSDESVTPWTEFTRAIHETDAKVFIQLFHSGRYSHPQLAKGQQPVAPSAIASRYNKVTPLALEKEGIDEVIELFAQAARRAKKAEFDGIEIIASAGYLICQFLSPASNQRTDEYGGSIENRARFGLEVVRKVREVVGPDFPISLRFSGNEFVPGGNTSKDLIPFAKMFELAGVDAFSVTGGWHETTVPQLPSTVPPGAFSYLASGIKRAVSVPVFASNRIVDPVEAEALLADGVADIINIGRSLIADPEWPNKARDGHSASIRPCVACMQGCMDRLFTLRPVECLCNPRAGWELKRRVTQSEEPRSVVIVGAGPAGLEAAITASDRGHDVTVIEKKLQIGGQLPLVAAPPGRYDFRRLMDFYQAELGRRNIRVLLDTEATAEVVAKHKPDVVLVATGSSPIKPNWPGLDSDHVVQAWDILARRAIPGHRVAVIGGGATGVEVALDIAERGTPDGETVKFLLKHHAETPEDLEEIVLRSPREVHLLEMRDRMGSDIGKSTRWVFLKELEMYGIQQHTEAAVSAVEGNELVYKQGEETLRLEVDTVVLALGARPNTTLADSLKEADLPVKLLGDAKKVRTLFEAIHEGFLAALEL